MFASAISVYTYAHRSLPRLLLVADVGTRSNASASTAPASRLVPARLRQAQTPATPEESSACLRLARCPRRGDNQPNRNRLRLSLHTLTRRRDEPRPRGPVLRVACRQPAWCGRCHISQSLLHRSLRAPKSARRTWHARPRCYRSCEGSESCAECSTYRRTSYRRTSRRSRSQSCRLFRTSNDVWVVSPEFLIPLMGVQASSRDSVP